MFTRNGKIMVSLLDHFIEKAPPDNDGAVEAQLTFLNGFTTAGAFKKGPTEGVYQLLTMGDKQGTREKLMINIFFNAEDLMYVAQMIDQKIEVPEHRIVIPGQ